MSQPASRASESTDLSDPDHDESVTAGTAFVVFVIGEIVALVTYVLISRPMWFFLDEWDFLANRTAFNFGDLFRAHNEHWVTLPALAYRALWWIFGLRSYRPYQVLIILLHLGAAMLVRTLMRRAGVRPWTATVVASILVFFGSGYQNIVLPFQITLVGSLVFGLVHVMLGVHDGPIDRRDYLALAAGAAAIMCSGVGVAMVIAAGTAVLISRGWRLALLHTVPLAGLYMLWFETVGHKGYTGYHAGLMDVARFVRLLTAATFGAIGQVPGVGIVLGLLFIGGLAVAWLPLRGEELRRQIAAPVALLVGAFALFFITGLGRAGHSEFQEKSRYLHLATAMLLPALAIAADAIMRRWRLFSPVVVIVLLVGIPGNISVIVDYMHKPIITQQPEYRQMMLSLPRVPAAHRVPRTVVPDWELAHFVTIGWLLDGAASGRIPKPHAITPADDAMDTLRLVLGHRGVVFPKRGDLCRGLGTFPKFHLERGQTVLLRAVTRAVSIIPPTIDARDTFPFHVVTVVGPLLVAREPVDFRMRNITGHHGQVCAKASIMHAAYPAYPSP